MGETGVGKTAIITYLSEIVQANYRPFNIHSGITEEEIINFVKLIQEEALQEIANCNQPSKQEETKGNETPQQNTPKETVLFFDEINTNDSISGLLKEIIIDKHLLGEPLSSNIRIVSACNPYKLKSKANQVQAGIRHAYQEYQKFSKLVYSVNALPESMISFVWDYGSLSPKEESEYIKKLIQNANEKLPYSLQFRSNSILQIASYICRSQEFIRMHEGQYAVSLRDAARFAQLLKFFLQNNKASDNDEQLGKNYGPYKRAIVLALSFCYMYRISSIDLRNQYLDHITTESSDPDTTVNPINFKTIIQEEQSRYLDKMEIPQGIGKNTPLKENIFVIITCILNDIPLIITGKPGSSKTLAMNLVITTLRGKSSNSEFFKKYPSLIQYTYQGSVQSTSRGIERIFNKAKNHYKKIEEQNATKDEKAIVIIDEIGLAEISPYNPLKVLHSLLEPPKSIEISKDPETNKVRIKWENPQKVPFVGISNWSLDASKMNRAVTLSRPDPQKQDLIESVESISLEVNKNKESIHKFFVENLQQKLVDFYYDYMQLQKTESHNKNFHGLRDFYSLIKFVCLTISSKEIHEANDENKVLIREAILKGIQRNFGGKDIKVILNIAVKHDLLLYSEKDIQKNSELIKENIKDNNARHLMVITDNQQNQISLIESVCQEGNIEYQIFYGSDFQEDKTEDAAYKQIYDIILCMERGILCILLNHDNIYQSFYDMLNQNYSLIGSQKFCRIAIGADSIRCQVHDNFKCVLIVEQQHAEKLDAPLLNRFEKQTMLEEQTLTNEERQRQTNLSNWIKKISRDKEFGYQKMFPTLNLRDLIYLISQTRKQYKSQQNDEYCKNLILQIANYPGIIRLSDLQNDESNFYQKSYEQEGIHLNLDTLLSKVLHYGQQKAAQQPQQILNEEEEKENFVRNQQSIEQVKNEKEEIIFLNDQNEGSFTGFNLIVHTYSAFIGDISHHNVCEQIFLSNIQSKKAFEEKVIDFYTKSQNSILLVHADSMIDSLDRINLCRSILSEQRVKNLKHSTDKIKHVLFIIRQDERKALSISFSLEWKQIFIDVLNGQGHTKHLKTEKLLSMEIQDIIKDEEMCKELISLSCVQAISNLIYSIDQDQMIRQLNRIQRFLEQGQNFNKIQELMLLNLNQKQELKSLNQKKWQLKVCKDINLIQTNLSFHSAAIAYLKDILVKNLTFIFYYLQTNGIINIQSNEQINEKLETFTWNQLMKSYKEKFLFEPLKDKYQINYYTLFIKYPFANVIHELFNQQKSLFIDEFKANARYIENLQSQQEEEKDPEEEAPENQPDEEEQKEQIPKTNLRLEDEKKFKETIEGLLPKLKLVFPQDLLTNYSFMNLEVEAYLETLPCLINPRHVQFEYNKFLVSILKIILQNNSFENLIEVYAVYWRYEQVISLIWEMVKIAGNVYSMDHILETISEFLKEQQDDQLRYLPRSILVKCLTEALYKLYFPTPQALQCFNDKNVNWAENSRNLFELNDDLLQMFLGVYYTQESQIIKFLLDFYFEVVSVLQLQDSYIIKVAKQISDGVVMIEVVQLLQELKQEALEDKNKKTDENKINEAFGKFIYSAFKIGLDNLSEQENVEQFIELVIQTIQEDFQLYQKQQTYLLPYQMIALRQLISIITECREKGDILEDFNQTLEQLMEEEPIIEQLSNACQMSYEDPFVVSLCDAIQQMAIDQNFYDQDQTEILEKLEKVLKIISNSESQQLDKIRSLAYFKAVAQCYVDDMISHINQRTAFSFSKIRDFLNTNFQHENEFKSLKYYIVKLLNQGIDLKLIRTKVSEINPWIKKLPFREETNRFYTSFDANLQQKILEELSQNQFNTIDSELKPIMKEQVVLSLVEHFYLDKNDSKDLLDLIYNNEVISLDLKRFLNIMLQKRDGFHKILTIDEIKNYNFKKFQILQAYLAAVAYSHSNTSFFNKIITKPETIQNIFLPFQVNVKEDPYYYHSLNLPDPNGKLPDGITRWRCKNCKTIFVVLDCGKLANHRAFHSMNCQKCGNPIGYGYEQNSEKVSSKKEYRDKFSTDSEALKGYIVIPGDELDGIKIRQLDELSFRLGEIIIHQLLQIALVFGSEHSQKQVIDLIFQKGTFEQVWDILQKKIVHSWRRIQQIEKLTDENILKLLSHIIQEMSQKIKSNTLKFESLESVEGRKNFENVFLKNCIPDRKGSFQEFFKNFGGSSKQNMPDDNLVENHIAEYIDISKQGEGLKSEYFYSIFRVQKPINNNEIRGRMNSEEMKLVQIIDERKEVLKKIKLLTIIIEWITFSFDKWNGKISYEDALDMNVVEFLGQDKLSYNKDMELFEKFSKATQELKGCSLQDGCDDIQLTPITKTSKFQSCLMTNVKKESLGYILYSMVMYLADIQNSFLTSVSEIQEFKWLQDKIKVKTKIFELTPNQIIQAEIDEKYIIDLIQEKSFSELKYGEGKTNYFILKEINKKLESELLNKKAFIQLPDEIDFKYSNMGSLSDQYEQISLKMEQVKYDDSENIISQLRSDKEKLEFLNSLRTAINFLAQSGGDKDNQLFAFMEAFKLNQVSLNIRQGVRLKHIIHIYEEIEKELVDNLAEKVHPRYRQRLEKLYLDQLHLILEKIKEEDVILKMKTIIGRLCIRHLTFDQVLKPDIKLFYIVFDDSLAYIHGIQEEQKMIEILQKEFSPCEVILGQSYEVFTLLKNRLTEMKNKRLEEQRIKEEEDQLYKKMAESQEIPDDDDNKIDKIMSKYSQQAVDPGLPRRVEKPTNQKNTRQVKKVIKKADF